MSRYEDEQGRTGSRDWDRSPDFGASDDRYDRNYGYYDPPYRRDIDSASEAYQKYSNPFGPFHGIRLSNPSHYGRGPKGWQRSNERIREEIIDRLTDHPAIDATDIDVQVQDGEVTLSGSVSDRYMKRMAEDVAESVMGVRDVQNRLRATAGLVTA